MKPPKKSTIVDFPFEFFIWLSGIFVDNGIIMFLNDNFNYGAGRKEVRQ